MKVWLERDDFLEALETAFYTGKHVITEAAPNLHARNIEQSLLGRNKLKVLKETQYQKYFCFTKSKSVLGGWDIIESRPMDPAREVDEFGDHRDELVATVTGPRAEEVAQNASGFKNSYAKEFYTVS